MTSECGKVYVGETGRTLKTNKQKRKRSVRKPNQNNAFCSPYLPRVNKNISLEVSRIFNREQNGAKKIIKQELPIWAKKREDTMGQDSGLQLHMYITVGTRSTNHKVSISPNSSPHPPRSQPPLLHPSIVNTFLFSSYFYPHLFTFSFTSC